MAAQPAHDRAVGDVDAGEVFRHPLLIVLCLTFVAGVLDAVGFGRFGVFTANQAGNLVIGWTLLPSDAAAALLSFASVLGCGLGVLAMVLLRHWFGWLSGRSGSRVLLVVGAALIVVATWVGTRLAPIDAASRTPATGSSAWWGLAASVALSAFSLALLAMVFISGGGVRAPILASTNAFVDAVRFGATSGLRRTEPHWRRLAARAAGFPLAWTLGAAATVLLPFTDVGLAAVAAAIIIGVALFARRVSGPADEDHRTVQ